MDSLVITDVAPRDGLQNQAVEVTTEQKFELVRLLSGAGVKHIEVSSFVSPKAVPQMADAAQVLEAVQGRLPAVSASVLVPNLRGLERAVSAGAREVAVVLSATETMNSRNINMSLDQARETSVAVLREALRLGLQTRAYVAVAFECPFEGVTPVGRLIELTQEMAEAGAGEVVVADTIGAADPMMIRDRVRLLAEAVSIDRLGLHLHDTRGMGVANAWAGIEAGIRRFDASAGGIGGCPFAPGAAGNLATEDLVLLAQRCGLETGIELDKLLEVIAYAEQVLGKRLGGRSSEWLRRKMRKRETV